jgi:phytoene dehydrogenase-like protein
MARAVVVGSGPNGLAAALVLADAGLEVLVLEAADRPGGGARSGELTVPGLIHDECSAAHPLALGTPFARRFDLAAHGLEWCWPEVQYSHPLDRGRGAAAYRSVTETAAGLGADGAAWRSLLGPLSERFDRLADDVLRPMLHLPRHPLDLVRFGLPSSLPASLLARRLASAEGRALFGGVAAHAFRPFTAPMSAAVGVMLGAAAHSRGWPVARGGSGAITAAMVSSLEELGGRLETGVEVTSLAELSDADLVMLDLAPAAAVRLAGARMPSRIGRALKRFRAGPGTFKVDFAVEGGVPWTHLPSRRAGTVHVGGELEEIAAKEKMVGRGRMPEEPFVLVCQQYLADPSRSRGDLHPLYAYAHVPNGYSGDATAAIEAQIERFAPGFRDRIRGRAVRSVRATEAYDANYVGGDVVGGANDARQLIFRPRLARDPYALGIPGVFLCSASTPPGAGAHGMCGFNAATSALRELERS